MPPVKYREIFEPLGIIADEKYGRCRVQVCCLRLRLALLQAISIFLSAAGWRIECRRRSRERGRGSRGIRLGDLFGASARVHAPFRC